MDNHATPVLHWGLQTNIPYAEVEEDASIRKYSKLFKSNRVKASAAHCKGGLRLDGSDPLQARMC
jgi:hypothetical protein